ncbi:hypothetical protein LCGC14_2678300 [marine sediment metagenome]|uniref:CARDB domain-containing protein n=1 Tax=marine sediment metagenome TaxID=412755 RepID=A0A0F9BWZ5_9ZZZZ
MNKKIGMIVGAVGLLVMMGLFASAFGASTSYWDDRPLKLAPGESKTVSLGLQNGGGGTEDITLRAELTNDGGGIATMVDEDLNYFVPVGRGAAVPVRIEVPEDAETGITHTITVSFTQVASGEGGMVRLTGGIVSKFPVEVVGEKESELYICPVCGKATVIFCKN